MDRKRLFILLMRLSAVGGALCGLLTVFLDVTVLPSMLGVAGFFFFRYLAMRELSKQNKRQSSGGGNGA